MRKVIGQQGEAKVFQISVIPECETKNVGKDGAGNYIISHSEKGHHHVVSAMDAEVLERTDAVPAGMQILYAIVKTPTTLRQTAGNAHEAIDLDPGIYEFRIQREFNPFADEARRVSD